MKCRSGGMPAATRHRVDGHARGAAGAHVGLRFQAAHEEAVAPGYVEARFGLRPDQTLELDDAARQCEVGAGIPIRALFGHELRFERSVCLQERSEIRSRGHGAYPRLEPAVGRQETSLQARLPDVANPASFAPRGDRVEPQALVDDTAPHGGILPRPGGREEEIAQRVEGEAGVVGRSQRGEKSASRSRGEIGARAQGQGYREQGGFALQVRTVAVQTRHRYRDALGFQSRVEELADLGEDQPQLGERRLGATEASLDGLARQRYQSHGGVGLQRGTVFLEVFYELGKEYDRRTLEGAKGMRLVGRLEAAYPAQEGFVARADGEPIGRDGVLVRLRDPPPRRLAGRSKGRRQAAERGKPRCHVAGEGLPSVRVGRAYDRGQERPLRVPGEETRGEYPAERVVGWRAPVDDRGQLLQPVPAEETIGLEGAGSAAQGFREPGLGANLAREDEARRAVAQCRAEDFPYSEPHRTSLATRPSWYSGAQGIPARSACARGRSIRLEGREIGGSSFLRAIRLPRRGFRRGCFSSRLRFFARFRLLPVPGEDFHDGSLELIVAISGLGGRFDEQ